MEEEQTKLCSNCKREIPSSNFTIHTVHCARNIRVCPVCKEPVPVADLQKHHDELHKQLPCKQCGESVCGTDLEDHIRDSCAQTIKSCRYCELELPRRELPHHESYCGVRTEQCSECKEWVMIKYRQLHLDSNHGFIRLDDDPPPISKPLSRPTTAKSNNSQTNGAVRVSIFDNYVKNINPSRNNGSSSESNGPVPGGSGQKPPSKRKNDQPQINTNVTTTNKVTKDLSISRGAVKKRPAPPPPPPAPRAERDEPYYSAVQRQQQERMQREQQNAINMAAGLPPVLNPAEKLEKLRKMDALQNMENNNLDYKNRNRNQRAGLPPGTVPGPSPAAAHVVADTYSVPETSGTFLTHNAPKQTNITATTPFNVEKQLNQPIKLSVTNDFDTSRVLKTLNTSNGNTQSLQNGSESNVSKTTNKISNVPSTSGNVPGTPRYVSDTTSNNPRHSPGNDVIDMEARRRQFKDLKPMSPEEFMERFKRIRMADEQNVVQSDDRMNEIKSSLRELRRELNQVTAPYNSPPLNYYNDNYAFTPPNDNTKLPCEFCGAPVPLNQLVLHQTGCRPDLAQVSRDPGRRGGHGGGQNGGQGEVPVIPCEFCTESLPVYLINEHQERCGREANLLYPD